MSAYASYQAITGSAQTTMKVLYGWQFSENAGTPAEARVLLRVGGASGDVIADIRLAGSQSVGESYSIPIRLGPDSSTDLYVEVASGTVRGAVYGG